MSTARFFSSRCIKPLYFMKSSDEAGHCGFIDGIVMSIILSLSVAIAGFKFYTSDSIKYSKNHILYGGGIIIVLLWAILPIMMYSSSKTMWQGYNNARKELEEQGFSKIEIVNILRMFEQRSAPLNISNLPGGMIFASKDKNGKEYKDEKSDKNNKD